MIVVIFNVFFFKFVKGVVVSDEVKSVVVKFLRNLIFLAKHKVNIAVNIINIVNIISADAYL